MGVEIPTSLGMDQANGLTIGDEARVGRVVIVFIAAVWIEEPVVVRVFVVVACNLLLRGAFRIRPGVLYQYVTFNNKE